METQNVSSNLWLFYLQNQDWKSCIMAAKFTSDYCTNSSFSAFPQGTVAKQLEFSQ